MGNAETGTSLSTSSSETKDYNFGSKKRYNYERVEDIPIGESPPSRNALVTKTKEISTQLTEKYDLTDLKTCQDFLKGKNTTNITTASTTKTILNQLGSYAHDSSKSNETTDEITYQFIGDENNFYVKTLRLSSKLNKDKTISYWIQYIIEPVHINMALLKEMNIPITKENIEEIGKRYKALIHQVKIETKNTVVRCEQMDPIYLKTIIKMLLLKNYSFKKISQQS